MTIKNIDIKTAKKWLEDNEAILIDVREPAEHKAAHISGSVLKPLGGICCSDIPESKKKIIIHCQKGARGSNACEKLTQENASLEVYNLEGGIEAWQNAGFPINSSGKKTLPLDRQVQLTIGLMVFTFSLLSYFAHPAFAFAAAFFGAGLINAGLTGWCRLGIFMAKMPWNR